MKRLAPALLATLLLGLAAGLVAGPQGFSPTAFWQDLQGEQAGLILGQIRAPRSLGALAVGALLGLAGAVAQGLFRNPLADPYLLGTAAGAGLAVVLVMATASAGGFTLSLATLAWIERVGLVGAAFVGALGGMALTLSLAAGAVNTLRLLLAGVVVAGTAIRWSPKPISVRAKVGQSRSGSSWSVIVTIWAGAVAAGSFSKSMR